MEVVGITRNDSWIISSSESTKSKVDATPVSKDECMTTFDKGEDLQEALLNELSSLQGELSRRLHKGEVRKEGEEGEGEE